LAETTSKIRIVAEYEDNATAELKKGQAALLDFSKAAAKAGKDISEAFKQQEEQAKKNSGTLGSLANKLGQLKTSYVAFAAAIASATVLIRKGISEASQYEQAVVGLQTSLGLIGVKSKLFVKSLEEQASALQRTTKFSDDSILVVQKMLTTFGTSPLQLKAATQAVVDFAAATGKSLEDAAQVVGNTLGGVVPRGLGRVTSELRTLSEEQLRAGEGLKVFAETFGGAAVKNADSFAGKAAQMANAIRDILKAIGELILNTPGLLKALDLIAKGFEKVAEFASPKGITERTFIPDDGGAPVLVGSASESREMEKQLQLSDKLLKLDQQRLEIAKQREKMVDEAEDLKKFLQAALETDHQRISREFNERMAMIERLAKAGALAEKDNIVKNEKERRRLQEETFELWKKQADEINQKEQKSDFSRMTSWKEFFQKPQNPEDAMSQMGVMGSISSGLQRNPAGTAIGAIWGPMGAALGNMLEDMIKSFIQVLPNILGSVLRDAFGVIKGLFSSIWSGIKGGFGLVSVFKSIFSWFSGPDYYRTLRDAIAEGMDISEFGKKLTEMSSAILEAGNQFRSPEDRVRFATRRRGIAASRSGDAFEDLMNEIVLRNLETRESWRMENGRRVPVTQSWQAERRLPEFLKAGLTMDDVTGVRIANHKKFQESLTKLGEELKKQADAVVEYTNLQIEMREKALEPIRETIQNINSEITRLKGAREQTSGVFKSAIDAVAGAFVSPQQTVADLQAQFAAATGESKGSIGEKLAAALQSQWEAARQLASQGAISGEELQRIQADILSQLEVAQAAATSEFDKLIAIQEKQLSVAEKQQARLEKQIEDLKASALKQIEKMDDILEAIKRNDIDKLIEYFRTGRTFHSGTPFVEASGPAMLQRGEAVIPASQNRGGGVVVNINGVPAGTSKEALTQAVREILIQNIGNFRGAVQKAAR
jgi:hypothetical protein